jgi:hypothetical protein
MIGFIRIAVNFYHNLLKTCKLENEDDLARCSDLQGRDASAAWMPGSSAMDAADTVHMVPVQYFPFSMNFVFNEIADRVSCILDDSLVVLDQFTRSLSLLSDNSVLIAG